MKQTFKRILSMMLSLLMLVSSLSVLTFAASNYTPDEEYYDNIVSSAVIVSKSFAGVNSGKVSFVYRGKTITETYDANIHFSSIQSAYNALKGTNNNPIIIVAPGTYSESVVVTGDITILGANAGVNPNVKGTNVEDPWTLNSARCSETVLKGVISVDKNHDYNVEVNLDGVKLGIGFAYVDAGAKNTNSYANLSNSLIEGAGSSTYGSTAINSVFYFAKTIFGIVTVKDCYASKMNASGIFGPNVYKFTIDGLFYTNSQTPALNGADANSGHNPSYVIKNSMFYDNESTTGVINVDHSKNDSASRTSSDVEVFNCVFRDGPSTPVNESSKNNSPIVFKVTDVKNKLNVHDNIFIGGMNYDVPAVNLTFTSAAYSASLIDNIKVNSNKFFGYTNVLDTTGHSSVSKFDFTGNYFSHYDRIQCDPVYPATVSYKNIKLDHFWINEEMTVSSADFHIKSIGISDYTVDHAQKIVYATLDYGTTQNINIVANDSSVSYKFYDYTKVNEVSSINTKEITSGKDKNTFYAVGSSSKIPGYTFEYTVVVTTYNPEQVQEFNLKDTYLLAPQAQSMAAGSVFFDTWDGMAYKFTVGKNAFATVAEIIDASENVPTIIMPAGTYTGNIVITGSAVLLGAKHGINPNLPQFEDPDIAWAKNPDRSLTDQETVLDKVVMSISTKAINATVVVDGFTFGSNSVYVDKGSGVETYNTSILKNIIVDGAGGNTWTEGLMTEQITTVFSFAGSDEGYGVNHKDVRLINIRMTGQGTHALVGDYYESLLMDGVYVAENNGTINKNEWTAPKGQNFYLEIRNSCFYKNNTTVYYFLVNNSTTNNIQRTSNRVVLDHNIFYNTTTNANGIFGIRFCGAKDSLKFVNNTFITSTATSIIPGNTNWFLLKSGIDKGYEDVEIVNDVEFKFNRFVKCTTAVDTTTNADGTLWDYSYNYFASSYSKGAAGKAVSKRSGRLANHATCDYYYTDWDLTTLNNYEEDKCAEFGNELKYSFTGAGVVDKNNKTYVDTVPLSAETYDFGIKLESRQAKYGVYADAACTEQVSVPVKLTSTTNTFYIKFSSYNDKKVDVYTATITRPLGTEADVLRVGKFEITDNTVNAFVPVGTTTFEIPAIQVSDGATYELFNDPACLSKFEGNVITGVKTSPTAKFIKVISADGNTEKVYSLSVLQADADQAVLSYIDGGQRVGANKFVVSIPANVSYFNIYPEYSDGASIAVMNNGVEVIPMVTGAYNIDSIASSVDIDIVVTSASGRNKNTYTVTISKDATSTVITSILGMVNNGDDTSVYYGKNNTSEFKVIAYLENSLATYSVYSDEACTKLCKDNIVHLTKNENLAYLKVTSPDGKSFKVYTLNITTSSPDESYVEKPVEPYYTVVGATYLGETNYYVDIGDMAETYKFQLQTKGDDLANTSYRIFSDASTKGDSAISQEVNWAEPTEVKITAKTTNLYIKVYVKRGTTPVQTDIVKLTVNSNRKIVKYNDVDKMAAWALEQINYLNDNGYGYFLGDSNGNFNPTTNISRYEVATVAIRVLGIDTSIYEKIVVPYKEVDQIPQWAELYVKACYKLNIMSGKEVNFFDGTASTTRQEFAKIITSVVALAAGETDDVPTLYANEQASIDAAFNAYNFADASNIPAWSAPYLKMAVAKYGLISGANNNGKLYVNPFNVISRQEVAIILANYSGYKK